MPFRKSLPRERAARALLILAPFLSLLLVCALCGGSLSALHPAGIDDLLTWRELNTLQCARPGWSGYFEETPPVGRLGLKGPGPMLLYGLFTRLFGLGGGTVVLCNLLCFTAACIVFCALRKPGVLCSLLMAALILLYTPALLYCSASSTEWCDYALLLFVLTFLLTYREKHSRLMMFLLTFSIVFAGMYRPIYCVLFLPAAVLYSDFRFGKKFWGCFCLFLIPSAGCCAFSWSLTSPNPLAFLYQLSHCGDIGLGLRMILSHLKVSCTKMFVQVCETPERIQRWLYLGTALCCIPSAFLHLKRRDGRITLIREYCPGLLLCALVLAASVAAYLMFGETGEWRDYRLLSPFLFFVVAWSICRERVAVPGAVLAVCTAVLILFTSNLQSVPQWSQESRFAAEARSDSMAAVCEAINYEDNAVSPYQNTIRTDIGTWQMIRELDPGMGLEYGWFVTENTGRSRWILTDRLKCAVNGYEKVLETEEYNLYRLTPAAEEALYE